MKQLTVALIAGIVFAIGLGVSGMTNPNKVLGFLDVTGSWDPSLALVMVGAIGAHVGAAQWAGRVAHPLWASHFSFPTRQDVDLSLVAGAVLFGAGWGVAGYCPGPAIVDLAAPSPGLIVFVLSMLAGTLAYHHPVRSARTATLEA